MKYLLGVDFGGSSSKATLLREDGASEQLDFEVCWRQDNNNPAIESLIQWMQAHEYTE